MIGKAIHIILKDKITELNSGGIYPVVMPQNANYTISSGTNYPSIVYHNYTEYEVSKSKDPNIVYARVMIQIISNRYKSVNNISSKVRDVLDHYVDKSSAGLVNVPGYNYKGNNHSFINNIDISHIFYIDEEDEYLEKLNIYTRRVEYEVYYYDDIIKLSYDKKNIDNNTPTNPLISSYDFTQKGLMFASIPILDGTYIKKIYNKLGKTICLGASNTTTTFNKNLLEYLEPDSNINVLMPIYKDGVSDNTLPYLKFTGTNTLKVNQDPADDKLFLPFGAMIILVYRPVGTDAENYILGSNIGTTDNRPLIISHKKDGSNITIKFNPNGNEFNGASRERTLLTSTDSSNYWGGDYHFLCLSLGGSKKYTGGTYNQQGWYEYFNSDYNPKLTTGQIIKNNSIAGNTDTMGGGADTDFFMERIGSPVNTSGGFNIYEMLIFVPNEKSTHNISNDAAPFQPTDIIYKKVKDYIYNKYNELK